MTYNELTRRHFANAACAGTASGPDWFRGEAGSRAQGTWVQFDVRLDQDDSGAIRSVRFLAFGCPHVIDVSQWLAAHAVRLPDLARLTERMQNLRRQFEVPVEKLGRLLIVEDAWVAALRGFALRKRG